MRCVVDCFVLLTCSDYGSEVFVYFVHFKLQKRCHYLTNISRIIVKIESVSLRRGLCIWGAARDQGRRQEELGELWGV